MSPSTQLHTRYRHLISVIYSSKILTFFTAIITRTSKIPTNHKKIVQQFDKFRKTSNQTIFDSFRNYYLRVIKHRVLVLFCSGEIPPSLHIYTKHVKFLKIFKSGKYSSSDINMYFADNAVKSFTATFTLFDSHFKDNDA